VDLGTFGAAAFTSGINEQGMVAGGSFTADGYQHAFLYASGALQDLGRTGEHSYAASVNNTGVAVGFISPDGNERHAAIFVDGTTIDLGTLGGLYSDAIEVNDAGDIIGYSDRADGSEGYFLYHDGVMTDVTTLLDPASGMRLLGAVGINDNGQILGWLDDENDYYNVLLTPVPAETAGTAGALDMEADGTVVSPVPEPTGAAAFLIGQTQSRPCPPGDYSGRCAPGNAKKRFVPLMRRRPSAYR
jgi:probable HAF family extracellular repeat protein